ncbi:MAG: hypothetical protein NDI77_12820 [Geobacteraceae bacterium]|nr:hypothetical protein [Geobacteraceae bacterium]
MRRPLLFIIVISLFVHGCSKDMSRREAKNKLKQLYPLYITVNMKKNHYVFSSPIFDYNGVLNGSQQHELQEAESFVNKLKASEYFDYIKRDEYGDLFDRRYYTMYYDLTPRAKARRYQVKSDPNELAFVVATKTIDKIIGITKLDNNHCKVEYTSTLTKNELYDLLNISHPSIENHTAYFILYDDGWRLQKVDEVVEHKE